MLSTVMTLKYFIKKLLNLKSAKRAYMNLAKREEILKEQVNQAETDKMTNQEETMKTSRKHEGRAQWQGI